MANELPNIDVIDLTLMDTSDEEDANENHRLVVIKKPMITKFTFVKKTRTNRLTILRPLMAEILHESCFAEVCKAEYQDLINKSKRTYVGESINPFIGLALFAAERVQSGDLICLYLGNRIPWMECEARTKGGENAEYFLDVTKGVIIDGAGVGHSGAMANHSCSPNAQLEHGYLNGPGAPPYGYLRAREDIQVGDEIEVNYHYWDPEFDPMPNLADLSTYIRCMCLKPNCRHVFALK